jgi:hypothetical protein
MPDVTPTFKPIEVEMKTLPRKDYDDICLTCDSGLALLSLVNKQVELVLRGKVDLKEIVALVTYPNRTDITVEIDNIKRPAKYTNGCTCKVNNNVYTNLTQAQCVAMGGTWSCSGGYDGHNGDGDREEERRRLEKELEQWEERGRQLKAKWERLR